MRMPGSNDDDPYHPTSLMLPKWSVIRGMAVAMMVLSMAIRNTDRQRAAVMMPSLSPDGYSASSSILSSASASSIGVISIVFSLGAPTWDAPLEVEALSWVSASFSAGTVTCVDGSCDA